MLFDAYIDKSNVQEKTKVIKRRFIQIIQSHTGSLVFEEFEAAYNRKAALYLLPLLQSVKHNKVYYFIVNIITKMDYIWHYVIIQEILLFLVII